MKPIDGNETCSAHSCLFGHPGGQGTNSGCNCFEGLYPRHISTVLRRNVQRMKARIESLEAEVARLREALRDMLVELEAEDYVVQRKDLRRMVIEALGRGKEE